MAGALRIVVSMSETCSSGQHAEGDLKRPAPSRIRHSKSQTQIAAATYHCKKITQESGKIAEMKATSSVGSKQSRIFESSSLASNFNPRRGLLEQASRESLILVRRIEIKKPRLFRLQMSEKEPDDIGAAQVIWVQGGPIFPFVNDGSFDRVVFALFRHLIALGSGSSAIRQRMNGFLQHHVMHSAITFPTTPGTIKFMRYPDAGQG